MASISNSVIDARYQVHAKVGEGGMAAVYQVFDQVAERMVALKRLTPSSAENAVVVALFEREFHTLKNLVHPHIVEAYDYGIAEAPYYTMELLEGTTINQLAPMPWTKACALLRDIASALALLHSRKLVHRDVTPWNILLATNGVVKLLDFGSSTPMGAATSLVGTAPFMAPEAVHRLALDQRTDVFALGATAYHLLAGRHAFPARRVADLPDEWRTRPSPPSSWTSGIPTELDELVMSMLDLKPSARPVNAGIVIARLSAIAGLPPDPSEQTARSFLTTPRLVGREREIGEFQRTLQRARGGRGSCIVIEAAPAMGRSRVLDAFALEAQMMGALVLRADGQDGGSEAETIGALCADLKELLPEEGVTEGDLKESTVATLFRLMRTRCLVLLIDDADRYGASSMALLTRLARFCEHQPLMLVVSHGVIAPDDALNALKVLRAHAERVVLRPLDLPEIAELLASCFDNTPHLKATAAWCSAVSAGRPGTCMELAQHLVDKGIATYEDGAWALPESFAYHSLPETAEQLLRERLRRLNEDQRLCGQLLSLIPPAATVTIVACADALQTFLPRERVHAALDGLRAEQLVSLQEVDVRMNHASVRDAFSATLPDSLTPTLHRLLAEYFDGQAKRPDRFRPMDSKCAAAHHLQQAGDQERAVRVVTQYAAAAVQEMSEEELAQFALPFGEWGATFEASLDYAEREAWPRRELYPLYLAIMSVAALSDPRWLARGQQLFEYLKEDTGLVYWSEPELDALEAGGRVSKGKLVWRLLRAMVRHLIAPRRRRGLDPFSALKLLGVYVMSALGACNVTQTFHTGVAPLARSLLPFRSLSPALDLLYEFLQGAADAGRGRAIGWRRLQGVLQRLKTRVRGMPEVYRSTAHYILSYLNALECRAPLGDPSVLDVAKWLEDAGGFDAHASQLRMAYSLYAGDGVSAERYRQELETRALTNARDNLSVLSGSKDVAQAQALTGDAAALRVTLESLESTTTRFPQWRGQFLLHEGEYARLVGDLGRAEDALKKALAFAPPGEAHTWPQAAAPYIEILVRLGRIGEAVGFATRALEIDATLGFSPVFQLQVRISAALAWAANGEHERAAGRLDELLKEAELQGVKGATLAVLEEARAKVALQAGDAPAFERACRGVARVFANHDSPALVSRYRRLVDEADRLGFGPRVSSRPPARAASLALGLAEIRGRIDHATSEVRTRRALELLISHCDAQGGHLFAVRGGMVECVASVGQVASGLELEEFVRSVYAMDADLVVGVTATALGLDDDVMKWRRWTSDSGATYDPMPLRAADHEDSHAVGIAILLPRAAELGPSSPMFLRSLARVLVEFGDFDALRTV